MAKSAGNFFRITELADQGFDPLAFRYLALQAKYRTKLNFSTEGLAGADRALANMRERLTEWASGADAPATDHAADEFEARFRAAIADDLDLPAAMALVAEVMRSRLPGADKARLLLRWDQVLALDLGRTASQPDLPPGANTVLDKREAARAARDFKTADSLRDELAALGVIVTDTNEGQRWKVVGRRT
jgi:cysteinyl-tRNA synthetase